MKFTQVLEWIGDTDESPVIAHVEAADNNAALREGLRYAWALHRGGEFDEEWALNLWYPVARFKGHCERA